MIARRTLYIDFESLKELEKIMYEQEFINFLNSRILIPTDDDAYYHLIKLRDEKITRNTKKLI